MKRLMVAAVAALASSVAFAAPADGGTPVSAKVRGHENIDWSISYAYGLTDGTKDLPRVLLVGDSICNGCQPHVREMLSGKMNVSYWISSYCVTSPNYLKFLEIYLDEAKYDVIHFNNGLHSLGTPTGDYARELEAALRLIRSKQPQAKIIWATSTPLNGRVPVRAKKVLELNAAAADVVTRVGGIATDDLFALLDPLDREKNWCDEFHHRGDVRKKAAKKVTETILAEIGIDRDNAK